MTRIDCTRESAIKAALASGVWDPELLDHIAECETCTDLMLVDTFLRRHATEISSDVSVPDPSFLWWRAKREQRATAVRRATTIINVVQRLAVGCGAVVAALGATRFWPRIMGALGELVPPSVPSPLPPEMAQPGLVMIASLAIVAVLFVIDLREPRTGD